MVAGSKQERQRQEQSTVNTARALSQAVERVLQSSVVGLQTLATSRALATRDFASFQRQADEALPSLAGRNIILVDASGRELVNTFNAYGDLLPQVGAASRQSVDAVFRTGKPVISDLFAGNLTHQLIVAVGVPVILDGSVAYYLGMGITPESLADILKRQNFAADWVAGIVDRTGTFVARTPNQEQFIGKKAGPNLLRKIAEGREGIEPGDTRDGMSVVVGFSRSTVSGWTVGIGVPREELLAPFYRSLQLTIFAAVALLLFALAIAWLISSFIASSIRALSEPALSLASDAPVIVPSLAIREANEIGGALVKASHLLKERRIAREEAELAARRESAERLHLAVSASRMGMFDWDLTTDEFLWSEECYRLLGYRVGEIEPSHSAWASRIHPDDRETAEAAETTAKFAQEEFVSEYRIIRRDGSVRWVLARGRFFYAAGKPVRMIGLKQDITEARQHVETQRILVAELQHRTRNLMAVVQSIAHQTLDHVNSLTEFEERFNRRLEALSRVQGLLSRADNEPITLGALVGMELDAIGSEFLIDRINFGGPEAPLRKSAVEMLSLAIHELLTNAIKYGALATPAGHLSVTWRIEGSAPDQSLALDWVEHGLAAPSRSADPSRVGFGRMLIEQALPYSLGAETTFDLCADRLHCLIRIPFANGGGEAAA